MDLQHRPLSRWITQADLPQMEIAARSEIRNPRLLRLYDYWMQRRGVRRYPARADLDPLDMSYLLGELVILDVHYAPLRFKYRLHGTKLVTRTGFDMTGKWVDEWPTPQYRARLLRAYTATVEAGASQRGERRIYDDGRPRRYEFLILPLAPNGSAKIDKLLVAVVHLDWVAGKASDIYQPAELEAAALVNQGGSAGLASDSAITGLSPLLLLRR